jgi:hypothetical protein
MPFQVCNTCNSRRRAAPSGRSAKSPVRISSGSVIEPVGGSFVAPMPKMKAMPEI